MVGAGTVAFSLRLRELGRWYFPEVITTISLIHHAIIWCDPDPLPIKMRSLIPLPLTLSRHDYFWPIELAELMLRDLGEWVIKGHAVSSLFTGVFLPGAHGRHPTTPRLPCCEDAKPHWEAIVDALVGGPNLSHPFWGPDMQMKLCWIFQTSPSAHWVPLSDLTQNHQEWKNCPDKPYPSSWPT